MQNSVVTPRPILVTRSPIRQVLSGDRLERKDRLKLIAGRLLFPRQTRKWLDFVAENDILREHFLLFPKVLSKIYLPYLSYRLSCDRRVSVLSQHYRFMVAQGHAALICRAASGPVRLGSYTCKSGAAVLIELTALYEGFREGDLCLRLVYQGQPIFTASLVTLETDEAMHLMIGRLQGMAAPHSRELVRQATRDLYGCRPGHLLILLARHLAYLWGCKRVLLVSNRNRIAVNLWRRLHINADYDRLWSEIGASRRADGDYQIDTLAAPQVNLAAIASNKRSEARKRQAMLQALFDDLKTQFSNEAPATETTACLPCRAGLIT